MTTLPPTWMCHACGYREYVTDGDWARAGNRLHAHEAGCPACLAQIDTALQQDLWRVTPLNSHARDSHDRPYWHQVRESVLVTAFILSAVIVGVYSVETSARLSFLVGMGGAYLFGLACGVEIGRRP